MWAHPDDESFAAGGLLSAASDAGSRIVCLTATPGEVGTTEPERWHPERLARTRRRELAAALAVLGVDELRWLPFADGACDRVAHGYGMTLVSQVMADVRPDTIVTFGPDGLTGHSDHRAVSRWTSNAWAVTRPNARLLWSAVSEAAAIRMTRSEPRAGAFYPGYPHITDDDHIAIHLDLRGDLLDRKLVALRAHASQTTPLVNRIGEDAFLRSWSTESFVDVGRPRTARSQARLAA